MKQRCSNPKNPNYRLYGGRGIKVSERWQKFENFVKDMGAKPSPEHSLDRKNNNKGYNRQNCRWATRTEQSRNKYNSLIATFNGKTQTIKEWAAELGIKYSALKERVQWGWGDRAFTEPVGRKGRKGRMPFKYNEKMRRDSVRYAKNKKQEKANHLKWLYWKQKSTPYYKWKIFVERHATFTMEDVIEYDKKRCTEKGWHLGPIGDMDDWDIKNKSKS